MELKKQILEQVKKQMKLFKQSMELKKQILEQVNHRLERMEKNLQTM